VNAREYEVVIGLEVHIQLATRSKLFCGCSSEFGGAPNSQVCATCLGYPGALPVLNREALRLAIRAGLAHECDVPLRTKFDRKNYFYPDLPKGYQISQFDEPFAVGGAVRFRRSDGEERSISLVRIHLEEDAGKSSHDERSPVSRIDLNRCGTPLLEMVSEPQLRDAEDADGFLRAVRETVRWIGVSDANMEEGSLRCDVNLSLRRAGSQHLGTRTEIKNLNSFALVRASIEAESRRQSGVLDGGGEVGQETRLYDPERDRTESMRSKEDAHDYRYLPEPDLRPVSIQNGWIEAERDRLGVLPRQRRAAFRDAHGLTVDEAAKMTVSRETADFFERAVSAGAPAALVCNWLQNEIAQLMNERDQLLSDLPLKPSDLATILVAVDADRISTTTAREVVREVLSSGADPVRAIESKGTQVSDRDAVREIVDRVLAENGDAVARLHAGDDKLRGFLMGQVMKLSAGKINPKVANEVMGERLGSRD